MGRLNLIFSVLFCVFYFLYLNSSAAIAHKTNKISTTFARLFNSIKLMPIIVLIANKYAFGSRLSLPGIALEFFMSLNESEATCRLADKLISGRDI